MIRNLILFWLTIAFQFVVWFFIYFNPGLISTTNINYFMFINIFLIVLFFVLLTLNKNKLEIKLKNIINREYLDAFNFGKLTIVVLDNENKPLWCSSQEFSNKIKSKKIENWLEEYQDIMEHHGLAMKKQVFGKTYSIKYSKSNHSFIFMDWDHVESITNEMEQNKIVIGYIKIDRYQDLVSSKDGKFIFDLSVVVRNNLEEWADKFGLLLTKVSDDTYKVICNDFSFTAIREDEFKFMEKIREETDLKIKEVATLSLGFGRNTTNITQLDSLALAALEKSEKRGGDQVVISNLGEESIYLGGNSEAKRIKSKTIIKNFANKLEMQLKKRGRVIVAGHQFGDYDAISSALAIGSIARKFRKNVKVVVDFNKLDYTAKSHLENFLGIGYINKNILSPKEAKKWVNKNTLAIIVDTSVPGRIELPQIIDICERKIVIDHHRIGKEVIENMTLEHIDPSASSTAEIIIEAVSFMTTHDKYLSDKEINLLLAGIFVDTNHFKSGRAGSRTFQAVAKLKEWGASQKVALELLKEPKDVLELRYEIVRSAEEVKPGIFIAKINEEKEITNSIIAQGAQTLMEINGARAAFVIGRNTEKSCLVSARSDGDTVNVQTIMEDLGGGGHFNAAATKAKLTTVKVMEEKLLSVLNNHIRG